MDKYKYIIMIEDDIPNSFSNESIPKYIKGEILEIDKILQMNPEIERYLINLKNGDFKWLWEKSTDVIPDFKLLTLGDLRKLKMNKIKMV